MVSTPPRIVINGELADRIDVADIPGMRGASRNVRARYLLDLALRGLEQDRARPMHTSMNRTGQTLGERRAE